MQNKSCAGITISSVAERAVAYTLEHTRVSIREPAHRAGALAKTKK